MTTNSMAQLQMVDLLGQYQHIQQEIDEALLNVVRSSQFIGGPEVKNFQEELALFNGVAQVIPCANGTDALQIAMMALGLQPGDEVIVPSFTYVATAEVIALLGLKPVMVDVYPDNFNIDIALIEPAVTPRTRAIVPVHLFGQSADMEKIMDIARKHQLFVIEDNAQAIGAEYRYADGSSRITGAMGHIGCTSFFPSKNLGCYGDGGAMMTNDPDIADRLRMVANHGQSKQYYHDTVGVNSRLDAIQAAVLRVKLRRLNDYNTARRRAADYYDAAFADVAELKTPARFEKSTHVFHQYTLKVMDGRRDQLREFLAARQIPAMIYYPVPLYKQKAFAAYWNGGELPVTEALSGQVISLPMHTELTPAVQDQIIGAVKDFFRA
jgi:UDP-2-acetamido-2-deoxy-ribo-hexuluronate aminotransferase